jgi:hypothetical protein
MPGSYLIIIIFVPLFIIVLIIVVIVLIIFVGLTRVPAHCVWDDAAAQGLPAAQPAGTSDGQGAGADACRAPGRLVTMHGRSTQAAQPTAHPCFG